MLQLEVFIILRGKNLKQTICSTVSHIRIVGKFAVRCQTGYEITLKNSEEAISWTVFTRESY
jgi:hypothetical protein